MVCHHSFVTKQEFVAREEPFNDCDGLYIGSHNFGPNPPAALARELFKPSPDSVSLLISI